MDTNNNDFEITTPKSFKLQGFLGKGTFGKVFKVCKMHGKDKDKNYAMKVVKKSTLKYFHLLSIADQDNNKIMIENAITEKDILGSVEHPFIIKLFYGFQTDTKIYLILEQASTTDLSKLLERLTNFSESAALFYIKQVVLAVEYLHSRGIMHRDIKPNNILIDSQGFIKLTDFGLSKNNFTTGRTYSSCGTSMYMAPEMFLGVGYGKEVDWWAVGVLLCRMLTGSFPHFRNSCGTRQPQFFGAIKPAARNLLIRLLQHNPKDRLGRRGAHEIKKHLYFKDTNWENVLNRSEKPPFVPKAEGKSLVPTFLKKLFTKTIRDSTASTIGTEYNALFEGFTFIGDIENAE